MIDAAPLPPPPTPRPAGPTGPTGPQRPTWAVWLLSLAVGAVASIAVGLGAGLLSASAASSGCSPGDGWCGLGAALVGLFVGVLAGAVAYVVGAVLAVRRVRPAGERAVPTVLTLVTPLTLGAVLAAVGAFVDAVG